MSNVIDFATYKESKKFSPFETDVSCGCGEKMWLATHYHIDENGYDTAMPEQVLVCRICTALIPLGKEE